MNVPTIKLASTMHNKSSRKKVSGKKLGGKQQQKTPDESVLTHRYMPNYNRCTLPSCGHP